MTPCKFLFLKKTIPSPVAKKQPHRLEKHGDIRVDDYFWLNERENPEVIAYLEAENAYTESVLGHTKTLQEALFEEMKARIKEDDASVPYFYNGYWYITRYETGKDYPIYARKKESLEAEEEIMFDCNQMSEGFAYFKLGGISISPNNRYAAFSVDTVSRRQYTIQIKDLISGEIISSKIENTTGGCTWASDNETLFYSRKDKITLRAHKIYKHRLLSNPKDDNVVYHEKDETFNTFVYKTKSRKYIVIGSSSTLTSEYRILRADNPNGEFQIFQKRIRGIEYSISHYSDAFYIITNRDGCSNFKLQKTSESDTNINNWIDVLPYRDHVLLEDIEIKTTKIKPQSFDQIFGIKK